MQQVSNDTLLLILNKDYPEIVRKIIDDVNSQMPANVIHDNSKIELIVKSFKKLKGIEDNDFSNKHGQRSNSDNRNLLLAVVLLFCNPQRLCNIARRDTLDVISTLSALTGVSVKRLGKTIPSIIVSYKVYKEFKNEVHSIYEQINNEHKFFN